MLVFQIKLPCQAFCIIYKKKGTHLRINLRLPTVFAHYSVGFVKLWIENKLPDVLIGRFFNSPEHILQSIRRGNWHRFCFVRLRGNAIGVR